MRKTRLWATGGAAVTALIVMSSEGSPAGTRGRLLEAARGWIPTHMFAAETVVSPEPRESLVARAKVWVPTDIPSMNLKTGPDHPGAFRFGETVSCTYLDKKLAGVSPKFACVTPDGDELKVKYGGANGEVYGEVMASRLLWALGFGADRMYSVRVICQECPAHIGGIVRENGDRIIDPAAVERKLGEEILSEWAWEELDLVSEESGGATRAERDALKLLAVLLQHSDSKPEQQRLVCIDDVPQPDGRCAQPLMMIQDVGVTFGRANRWNQQPRGSVNLAEWREIPVWRDDTGCVGNLSGSFTGTLKDPVISEAGRQFLADLLVQLSDQQLRDMFEAARVHLRTRDPANARSGFAAADEWVEAFKAKRLQIAHRRCA